MSRVGRFNRYVPAEDRIATQGREMSPAEQIVEAGSPLDLSGEISTANFDSNGEAIRPWEPKGEEDLGKPGKKTVEGENLEFSVDPPQTAGGAAPQVKTPFGRFSKDES